MKTVRFNPSGGPLSAEVRSGHAQPGSYLLRLWAADDNTILLSKEGNFINTADDEYGLPDPPEANDRRIVQAFAVLALTPPVGDYSVDLVIHQDGAELGREAASGQSENTSLPVNLFLKLTR